MVLVMIICLSPHCNSYACRGVQRARGICGHFSLWMNLVDFPGHLQFSGGFELVLSSSFVPMPDMSGRMCRYIPTPHGLSPVLTLSKYVSWVNRGGSDAVRCGRRGTMWMHDVYVVSTLDTGVRRTPTMATSDEGTSNSNGNRNHSQKTFLNYHTGSEEYKEIFASNMVAVFA